MKNNKILCVLPKHAYGDKKRDLTAEYSLFYLTLKKMLIKNNISFFDVYKKNKTILENNNLLLKKIYKFKPNIIFFSITQYEIYIDTLKIIKNNLDCKIINWYSDDTWRFSQQSIFYSKYFDLNITDNAGLNPTTVDSYSFNLTEGNQSIPITFKYVFGSEYSINFNITAIMTTGNISVFTTGFYSIILDQLTETYP